MTDSGASGSGGCDADLRTRYAPSIEDVAYSTGLLMGSFALQPISSPDRTVVACLANTLRERGLSVPLVEPAPGEWRSFTDKLLELGRATRRPDIVVVSGPAHDDATLATGLSLLNQKRDLVAGTLSCPVLWCGSESFFDASWRAMPDMWSVRALPIKLVAKARTTSFNATAVRRRIWFADGLRDDPARLERMLHNATALEEPRLAVPTARRLAVALAARRQDDRAAAVLTAHRGRIDRTPQATERCAFLLTQARLALLRQRVDEAEASLAAAAPCEEAGLHGEWDILRAVCLISRGEMEEAQHILQGVREDAGEGMRISLMFERGVRRALLGDTEVALEFWREALSLCRKRSGRTASIVEASVLFVIGCTLRDRDRFAEAIDALTRASELFQRAQDADGAELVREAFSVMKPGYQ